MADNTARSSHLAAVPEAPSHEALALAVHESARSVAELLAAGAPPDPPEGERPWRMALHDAAEGGHVLSAKLLLDAGADPHRNNEAGCTALHAAARGGSAACVKLLLRHVDVNQPDRYGDMALHEAMRKGDMRTIRALVESGANLEARDTLDRTPLAKALDKLKDRPDALRAVRGYLLSVGASSVSNGRLLCHSPFMGAVQKRDLLKARRLADLYPEHVDANEHNIGRPLHVAARNGDLEMVRFLLAQGARPARKDGRKDRHSRRRSGWRPVEHAASHGHANVVRVLLDAMPQKALCTWSKATYLCRAAASGSLETVQALLDAGADPHVKGEADKIARDCAKTAEVREALHQAMIRAFTPATRPAPHPNAPALAKRLLSERAGSELVPDDSIMSKAVEGGRTEIVELLLASGATLRNAADTPGWDDESVAPMPKKRPSTQWIDNHRKKDFVLAFADGLSGGLGEFRWDKASDEEALAWVCDNEKGHSHYVDALTPLHMAAAYDKPRALAKLLDNGAHLNETDHYGRTALMLAAARAGSDTVKALLRAGANPDGIWSPQIPLAAACERGNLAAAQALLDAGADPNRHVKA